MASPTPVNASLDDGTEVAGLVAGPVPLRLGDAVVGVDPPWLPEVLGLMVVLVVGAAVVVVVRAAGVTSKHSAVEVSELPE